MNILVRSWQDLGRILADILSRSRQGIHFAMVRSYQESYVPKKFFFIKSYLVRKKSEMESAKIIIYRDWHC